MDKSLPDASYEALKLLGKDSTSNEILKTINEKGLYPKRELYDTMSISTPIDVEIKTEGYNSRFVKKGHDIYGLKESQDLKFNEWEPLINYWNIYITPNLREEILITNNNDFCKSMYILCGFLSKWEMTSALRCDIPFVDEHRYPIILGTEEEVKKRRIDFKRINENICSKKIELIQLISDANVCDNFDEIHQIISELQGLCEVNDRYAFYRPKRCESEVSCHPVVLSHENDNLQQCHISPESINISSGFIMLPYDRHNEFVFTPKFYQALCHELFHAQVIDIYRGSKRINEGLPELYSEICYYQFVEEFLKKLSCYSPTSINEFKQAYMRFQIHGSYKPYYKFIKKQLDFRDEEEVENCFDDFSSFICELMYLSVEQIKLEYKFDIPFLKCAHQTPYWQYIFEKTINEYT